PPACKAGALPAELHPHDKTLRQKHKLGFKCLNIIPFNKDNVKRFSEKKHRYFTFLHFYFFNFYFGIKKLTNHHKYKNLSYIRHISSNYYQQDNQ
ncbi:MAG: hypothetical protein RR307_04520, partial [Clostridia bacterium]